MGTGWDGKYTGTAKIHGHNVARENGDKISAIPAR